MYESVNGIKDLPVTDKITVRPVYARYLRRKHHMPLGPITEEEKQDAIRILEMPYEDALTFEAFSIFEEASRPTP